MSIHKLTAGSGYDYLTRQVAALDATEKGHTGYTERGESPGMWTGSGLAGIDRLTDGDPVTAEQMRALFGCGLPSAAVSMIISSKSRRWRRRGPTVAVPKPRSDVSLVRGVVVSRAHRWPSWFSRSDV